jgi:hypothetical protein
VEEVTYIGSESTTLHLCVPFYFLVTAVTEQAT